jgi:hypothetical protein
MSARQQKRAIRQCIFCPTKGRMSEEHVWPKWIRRYVPFDTPAHVRASIEYQAHQENILHAETRRGDPRYRGVHFVCHGCNTGWMSALQNAAKSPLLAMARGEARHLSEDEQKLVAAWATMSVMTAEHLYPDAVAISSADRLAFAQNAGPLPNWRIWAASAGDNDWKGFHVHGTRSLSFPDAPITPNGAPNTQTTTLVIGKAYFHAFSSHSPRQAEGIEMDMTNGALKQLWPMQGSIQWPPPTLDARQAQQLTTAVFEMIDDRFGHDEPRFDPERLFQL